MATRQSVSWIELRVGVLVLASFVLLAAAIFFVGGETGFFTPTYTITAYFESANGMNTGAEVWLEGVTVGNVRSVQLSNLPEPERSVAVEMSIDQQYQNLIFSDSLVTVQTIGLLGDSYVDISRGPGAGDPLLDGGTLQGQGAGRREDVSRSTPGVHGLAHPHHEGTSRRNGDPLREPGIGRAEVCRLGCRGSGKRPRPSEGECQDLLDRDDLEALPTYVLPPLPSQAQVTYSLKFWIIVFTVPFGFTKM